MCRSKCVALRGRAKPQRASALSARIIGHACSPHGEAVCAFPPSRRRSGYEVARNCKASCQAAPLLAAAPPATRARGHPRRPARPVEAAAFTRGRAAPLHPRREQWRAFVFQRSKQARGEAEVWVNTRSTPAVEAGAAR